MVHTYWKSLDGLRAVAVGLVMLAHAGSPYPKSGGVGVDIFFVLSGFLITGLLSTEYLNKGCISRKSFYLRRLLRLCPCLFSCVLLFILLSLMTYGSIRYDIVVIVLTYTANYARALFDYDLQSLSHCWSLAIEEQYYILWPIVIHYIEKHFKSNQIKFMILLCSALAFALYRASMVGVYDAARIYFALDTHMDGLIMGSSLSYLIKSLSDKGNKYKPYHYILLSRFITPCAIAGLMVVMYFITWASPWMGRAGYTLVAFASCVIILDVVVSPHSIIRKVLELSPLVYIGKISYGLYLYHYPIFHFVKDNMHDLHLFSQVIIMFASSIFISTLSYRYFESIFIKLKYKI